MSTPEEASSGPWKPMPEKLITPYTKFNSSSDRLSLNRGISKIYTGRGTIYSEAQPDDAQKWTYKFSSESDKEENRYGRKINRGGDPNGNSELVPQLGVYPGIVDVEKKEKKDFETVNKYAGQTHAHHETFKTDMEFAIRNNGFNSVGMQNDTKRKEIIDSLASNNNDLIGQYLPKSNKDEDFVSNSKLKYESRYDNNKDHLNKKKIPSYKSGSKTKSDEYDKLYPLSDDIADVKTEHQTWKSWDFIPFVLHDLVNKKYLPFRSYINAISDQSDAQYTAVKYLGRADSVQVYNGFTRILSLDFTAVSFTLEELHPMWQRLNYLVGLTQPSGYTNMKDGDLGPAHSSFVIPPFIRMNLGDMYKDQPCIITSVGLTIPQEASWELTKDSSVKREGGNYEFLNGTIKKPDILVGQYPNMAQVNISFTLLEKRLPKTKNRHFGHYNREDNEWDVNHYPDKKGDRKKGFNYNLIHSDPDEVQRELTGEIEPSEPIEPNTIIRKEIDPFEGSDTHKCTTYPPSHYYKQNGNLTKKDQERIDSEVTEWKKCACEHIAKIMNEESADSCVWEDDCIKTINGKIVPEGLKCTYTTAFQSDPVKEDDEVKKPPMCPYEIGDFKQTDEKGRVIGYQNKSLFENDSSNYREFLKGRNLNYWIKDLTDYLANEMGQPKFGSSGYKYETINGTPSVYNVKKVTSGSLVLEFDSEGFPFSYNGAPIDSSISGDFKVNCSSDDKMNDRELAGNYQPSIVVDLNSNFKIIIDAEKDHYITKENYTNTSSVKSMLAEWVAKTMSKYADNGRTSEAKESWINLDREETDIYYVPYETDFAKQITAYKVFPGKSDYVNYEVDNDVSEKFNIGGGKKYAQLKFGMYAIVSNSVEKLSGTTTEKQMESTIGDTLYRLFFEQNYYGGATTGTLSSGSGVSNRDVSGDGTQLDSQENAKKFLDPGNLGPLKERKDALERLKSNEIELQKQMRNENVPCLNYEIVVGKWSDSDKNVIIGRMKNMEYQKIIKEKVSNGATRVAIENLIFMLDGTSSLEIEKAESKYYSKYDAGELTPSDPELKKYTDINFIDSEIERINEQIKEIEDKQKRGEIEDPIKEGYYFGDDDSSSHYEPWRSNHAMEKIDFVEGTFPSSNDSTTDDDSDESDESNYIGQPKPTTESPTPVKRPIWEWSPIDRATKYEVEFMGSKQIISNAVFKSTIDLSPGKYTIKVKAGAESRSGKIDWSQTGSHTVTISEKALPPKPSNCPYPVVREKNAKDKYGRLIGLPSSGEFSEEQLIERNVKMWMGDVMAYIIANEKISSLPFPADPSQVSWRTNDKFSTSTYGRSDVVWSFSGKKLSNLSGVGNPVKINGKSISAYNEFNNACGERIDLDKDTAHKTDGEKLATPKPNADTPTDNTKPEWTWESIASANTYKVSLRKVKPSSSSDSSTWSTIKDYGVIHYSPDTSVTPFAPLDEGTYEISVIAEKKSAKRKANRMANQNKKIKETIMNASDAGTHIVEIKYDILNVPKPTSDETTSSKTITWTWEEIKDAVQYDVYLKKIKYMDNGNVVTITDFGKVDNVTVPRISKTVQTVEDDGYYEISVIARNDTISSAPGTHVVYVDSDFIEPTPSPSPSASPSSINCKDLLFDKWNPFPNKNGLSDIRICEDSIRGRNRYIADVAEYLACVKFNKQFDSGDFPNTRLHSAGHYVSGGVIKGVTVRIDGKLERHPVGDLKENIFNVTKGDRLESASEREQFRNSLIPNWNKNDTFDKIISDAPELNNCPGSTTYIGLRVFHNNVQWKGQTNGAVPSGHEPGDTKDKMPESLYNKTQQDASIYFKKEKNANDPDRDLLGRWWLTEEEDKKIQIKALRKNI